MATTTNNGWETPDDTDLVKDGALAMRTLGNAIDTSVGTGLLAWTSWTPTLTGITLGNGTITSRYLQIGKTVHFSFIFTLGTTSAITGAVSITLPISKQNNSESPNSTVTLRQTGVTPTVIGLARSTIGSNVLNIYAMNTASTYIVSADLTATIPWTWASTHTIGVSGTYEAA